MNDTTDIISITLGGPGAFCFGPDPKAQSGSIYPADNKKKIPMQREMFIHKGYRGCVALFNGDMLIMTGSFQLHMQHKTLSKKKSGRDIEEIKTLYPAMNDAAVRSMRKLHEQLGDAT